MHALWVDECRFMLVMYVYTFVSLVSISATGMLRLWSREYAGRIKINMGRRNNYRSLVASRK